MWDMRSEGHVHNTRRHIAKPFKHSSSRKLEQWLFDRDIEHQRNEHDTLIRGTKAWKDALSSVEALARLHSGMHTRRQHRLGK
jgi:hypothetical protein